MQALVQLENISQVFWQNQGFLQGQKPFQAVSELNLQLFAGETLGLVGESGCGKSTLARIVVGLLPPSSGRVVVDGLEVYEEKGRLPSREKRKILCSKLQMVFQDPYSSLNPRMSIIESVGEPLRFALEKASAKERETLALAMLEKVGIAKEHAKKYPHEFSGGQRQRIAIARALVVRPKVVVCDEPTSSLDASVQAQVLNLLCDLQEELGLAYLFISHDLAVVRHMSDRVAVMHQGRIVENAETRSLFTSPTHPYTKELLCFDQGQGA